MISFILKWLPGGQILSVIGGFFSAIVKIVAWFFKWLGADIADGFKEPQRFIARLACMLLVFVVGGWLGIRWDHDEVTAAKGEVASLHEQWNKKDEEDAQKAAAAKAAREAAEQMERQRIEDERKAEQKRTEEAAAVPAAPAQRVRVPSRATPKGGPGLFTSFPSIFGTSK